MQHGPKSLTPPPQHEQLVHVLEWVRIERAWLAKAFVSKSALRLPTRAYMIERLILNLTAMVEMVGGQCERESFAFNHVRVMQEVQLQRVFRAVGSPWQCPILN